MNIWSVLLLSTAELALAVIVLMALRTTALERWEHKDVLAVPAQRVVTLSADDADEAGKEAGYGAAPGNRIVRH